MTSAGSWGREERPDGSFAGNAGMLQLNSVLWSCVAFRVSVFSQMRFAFRRLRNGRPAGLFSTPALAPLARPWATGTTQDLLARMMLDVDLAGNAFVTRRPNGQLRRVRPDWVTVIAGVRGPAGDPAMLGDGWDLDAELLGFFYDPPSGRPEILMPDQVAHFAPMPDPLGFFRGMSWITRLWREIRADDEATIFKSSYWKNAATPNFGIVFDKSILPDKLERFKALIETQHKGALNAFKTLYLGGGANVVPIGNNLHDSDLRNVMGKGETRIANAAGIHPTVLGLSEGLSGSSLNAGNYSQARRATADNTLWPLWRNAVGCLANIVDVPGDAELWFDITDVPFLRQDRMDVATIQEKQAAAMRSLVDSGWKPETVRDAVDAEDWALMTHTGIPSIQVQQVEGGGTVGDGE